MLGRDRGKVFVGLSGGVDSAVSAALLRERGYEVTGVFIRIALPGYPCPAAEDRREAMRAAAYLDIPFREIDLSEDYGREVFTPSLAAYTEGKTPNPDTLCNREIKFGLFYRYAQAHGAAYIATGHYAQTQKRGDRTLLYTGRDPEKDQSYFLWAVPEEVLPRVIFPVGNMHKQEVRQRAAALGLPNAARKDSQGLCFLGDISIEDMLQKELSLRPGEVLSEGGEIIGHHRGAAVYTLGERHGFTLLPHIPRESPYFVVGKDMARNTITVSAFRYPTGAHGTYIWLKETNWIGPEPHGEVAARYRYRQPLISASVDATKTLVTLNQPHYVPAGQSLVLYDGERCLGGGVVDKSEVVKD